MDLGAILGLVLIVACIYFLLFRSSPSDLVYSSSSESDVRKIQTYLEGHGIRTYTKNLETRNLTGGGGILFTDIGNPSLHVLNAAERERAIALIREPIEKSKKV